MPDFNATIAAVDSAMDSFDDVLLKAGDFSQMVERDVQQLGEDIRWRISMLRRRLEALTTQYTQAQEKAGEEEGARTERSESYFELETQIHKINQKIARLEALEATQARVQESFLESKNQIMRELQDLVSGGNRKMGEYIRAISKFEKMDATEVSTYSGGQSGGVGGGASDYRVVIIDSQRYPESAEHIRVCARMGYPVVLTLNRSGADDNRDASLEGYESRRKDGFDRDEFPPAAFCEGGAGAHVFYLTSSDNRGSGSSFGRQLLNVRDGTRVRFRVI